MSIGSIKKLGCERHILNPLSVLNSRRRHVNLSLSSTEDVGKVQR